MRKHGFFDQWPTPIDTSEIGFNILDIPEVRTSRRGGYPFEITCLITTKDIIEEYKKLNIDIPQNSSPFEIKMPSQYIVADVKCEKMKTAVEELRLLACEEFTKQLKTLSNGNSYFYIPKERIVQFVSVPVSFTELAPGNTSIHFRVFTERFLGEIEDA